MKPFELIVWGIVTIVIVLILMSLFGGLVQEENLVEKIETNLKQAQLPNLIGRTINVGTINLSQDQILTITEFETLDRSLVIECNNENICCPLNEECQKPIEWDQQNLNSKKTITTNSFVRCTLVQNYPACKIYIGNRPAQSNINNIELVEQIGTSNIFEIIVENTGNTNLVFGKLKLNLSRKVDGSFQKINYEFDDQEIQILPVSTKHTFIWNIETDFSGEYKAEFIFSGENSGYDKNSIEFFADPTTNCKINENKFEEFEIDDEELMSRGYYMKEYYYCDNCNYAFECLAEWNIKHPNVNFNLETKERVSCYSQSGGSTCIEEAEFK